MNFADIDLLRMNNTELNYLVKIVKAEIESRRELEEKIEKANEMLKEIFGDFRPYSEDIAVTNSITGEVIASAVEESNRYPEEDYFFPRLVYVHKEE